MALPKINLHFEVKKNGLIIKDQYEEGHSWTRNGWNMFAMMMMYCGGVPLSLALATGSLKTKSMSGVLNTAVLSDGVSTNMASLLGYGLINNTTSSSFGILVGSGTKPFSVEDFQLSTLIPSGINVNNLVYSAQTLPAVRYANRAFTTVHSRVFNNNSPSPITVTEVGFCFNGAGQVAGNTLVSRDLLEIPIEIPVGSQLTVNIELSANFSAIDIPNYPIAGDLVGGGMYLAPSTIDPDYTYILSPIVGGQSAPMTWANVETSWGLLNNPDGYAQTQVLMSKGADSTIGTFCSGKNAENFNGHNDWFVRSDCEAGDSYSSIVTKIPADYAYNSTWYWSSSEQDASQGRCFDNSGNSVDYWNKTSMSHMYPVRLIRKALISDIIAEKAGQ